MNTTIVTGLFTIGGTLIGALASIASAKINQRANTKDKVITRLASQVKAYWALEQEYVLELQDYQGTSKTKIKASYREKVREKGYDMPNMTANDVDKLIDNM